MRLPLGTGSRPVFLYGRGVGCECARAAALAHVLLGLAAVWVTATGEGRPRALGGAATLASLLEPLGRPLLLAFVTPAVGGCGGCG